MIWSLEHAIAVVRQLRQQTSEEIRIYRQPENAELRANLEHRRAALFQAECCLIEAAKPQYPKSGARMGQPLT